MKFPECNKVKDKDNLMLFLNMRLKITNLKFDQKIQIILQNFSEFE